MFAAITGQVIIQWYFTAICFAATKNRLEAFFATVGVTQVDPMGTTTALALQGLNQSLADALMVDIMLPLKRSQLSMTSIIFSDMALLACCSCAQKVPQVSACLLVHCRSRRVY